MAKLGNHYGETRNASGREPSWHPASRRPTLPRSGLVQEFFCQVEFRPAPAGESATLIITRDDPAGGIDAQEIAALVSDTLVS